jgi:hypothetical protein
LQVVYRSDLLSHVWMVHGALSEFDAEASLDLKSLILDVWARNRYYRLHPRFVVFQGDRIMYTQRPSKEMRGFAGWLPYVNKRWPIGSGKFAFKGFCAEKGLPTPKMWLRPEPDMRDFLVKYDQSSSGAGMRGPFAGYRATESAQVLEQGGYYEQFIHGDMVKAWYWQDRLVGLQTHSMPTILGNGASTVRELLARGAPADSSRPLEWAYYEDIAGYQNMSLSATPPAGQVLLADFRYTSPLLQGVYNRSPTLERYQNSPLLAQLERFGPILWAGIPADVRPAALYTLDAIADAEGKAWLLEMNCNPAVHPEAYPSILETLFGEPGANGSVRDLPPPPQGALPGPSAARAPMPGTVPLSQAMGAGLPLSGKRRFRAGVS